MKLKLTNTEMMAMVQLFYRTVINYQRMLEAQELDNDGRLYKILFEEMWLTFQRRAFEKRARYNMDFKERWAIAFYQEFNDIKDVTSQLGNLCQTICNKVHQKFLV